MQSIKPYGPWQSAATSLPAAYCAFTTATRPTACSPAVFVKMRKEVHEKLNICKIDYSNINI